MRFAQDEGRSRNVAGDRVLQFPIADKLLEAVEIRNYLAHHFLREFFMAVPSEENLHDASSQLADLSVWLEELDAELDRSCRNSG